MQIAYREWRVRIVPETRLPILQSVFMSTFWDGSDLTADMLPEDDTGLGNMSKLHGIHAVVSDYPTQYKPPTFLKSLRTTGGWPWVMLMAIGALDVSGKVVEHEDGVLRAERVRILALRLDERIWIEPSCGHKDYAAYSGIRDDCWVLRRQCGGQIRCRKDNPVDEYMVFGPAVTFEFETTVVELERQLLERYEVPRLPDDKGPWIRRGPIRTSMYELGE